MDIQDSWEKAVTHTSIVRPRVQGLSASSDTALPYIFLAESSLNAGDTVVRKGEVLVEKPALILPSHIPQFEGFDFEQALHVNEDTVVNFLLVRGVQFPSLKYNNRTHSLDVYEGALSRAIDYYSDMLQRSEDVHTGLVAGPEDCWQFSVLVFICSLVVRSADGDIKKLLEELRRRSSRGGP